MVGLMWQVARETQDPNLNGRYADLVASGKMGEQVLANMLITAMMFGPGLLAISWVVAYLAVATYDRVRFGRRWW